MRRFLSVVAASVLACSLAPRGAAAGIEGAACSPGEGAPIVMLADSAERPELAPYAASIASQLDDLPVCFRVDWRDGAMADPGRSAEVARGAAAESGAVVVFWLVPAAQGYQLRLFLPRRGGESEIARDIEVTSGGGLEETLAVIVRVSITTAIADPGAASAAAPARRSEVDRERIPGDGGRSAGLAGEEAPGESRLRGRFALSAAYAVGLTAAGIAPVQGAELGIGVRISERWAIDAAYAALTPIDSSDAGLTVTLRRHPVRLGGRAAWPLGRVELGARVSLGVDYVTEGYDVTDPSLGLDPDPEPRVQASIIPALGAAIRLHRVLYATAVLSADIVCNQYRYSVVRGGEKTVVYDPWVVQPALAIGLELRFLP